MKISGPLRKYGMYVVDEQEFFTKKDALEYAKNDSSRLKFSMFGTDAKSFDISADPYPNLSLHDLYRARAEDLRAKYDYLVLALSGGPDSTNILETFVNNQIHLDEIVNFNSYSRTGKIDGNNNLDYVHNVLPRLQELTKDPKFRTKITIVDDIDALQNLLGTVYVSGHIDLLPGSGGLQRFGFVSGDGIAMSVPHLIDMIKDGKNVGIITGVDKPSSVVVSGKRYLTPSDSCRWQFVEWLEANKTLPFYEWFYQSDRRILHKQSYLLDQFVKNHPQTQFYQSWRSADPSIRHANSWPSADGKMNLRYEYFHSTIYPGQKQNIVTAKDSDMILMPRFNSYLEKFERKIKQLYYHTSIKWIKDNNLSGPRDPNSGRWQIFYDAMPKVYMVDRIELT